MADNENKVADTCVMGNVNQQRILSLEKRFNDVAADIKEIKEKLLGRPSWFISLLISGLISALVGLIVAFVNINGKG